MEWLAGCTQALWSYASSVVDHAHGLMALVARQLDMLIFNDILFNDGLSQLLSLRLLQSRCVNVCVGNKATVSWNVSCHFLSAHCQSIRCVLLLDWLGSQNFSWVITICTYVGVELSVVLSSWRTVTDSVDTPCWPVRRVSGSWACIGSRSSVAWNPMISCADVLFNTRSSWLESHGSSFTQSGLFCCHSAEFGEVVQFLVVHELVADLNENG
jgi:hypothetical protein